MPGGRVRVANGHDDGIVYRVREDSILVLTVFEGHRLFPPRAEEADDEWTGNRLRCARPR